MSQAIAALVHAAQAQAAQATRDVEDAASTTAAALPLPPITDDYPYPETTLQHIGFFILFFFPTLALTVVALRVYNRVSTKQFGWDDGLICFAMAESLAETIASYFAMRYAFIGIHVQDIPAVADHRLGSLWNYIIQLLYNPILALVKCSVLLFLLRLSGQKRRIRYAIIALNVFNLTLMVAIFATVVFQCRPISYFWDKAGRNPPTDGSCIDMPAFYVSTASLTILTDVLALALPFWIFLGLKMPSRLKMALLAVFGLGAVVTAISILRLVWLVEISYHMNTNDPTYDIRFTYSAVETNLAIITASAPALRGLVLRWFPKLFSSLKSSTKGRYSRSGGAKTSQKTTTATATTKGRSATNHTHSDTTNTFPLKSMKKGRSETRAHTPTTSEEAIITYDGIMRTREIDIVYDDERTSMPRGDRRQPLGEGVRHQGSSFDTKLYSTNSSESL